MSSTGEQNYSGKGFWEISCSSYRKVRIAEESDPASPTQTFEGELNIESDGNQ